MDYGFITCKVGKNKYILKCCHKNINK